MQNKSKREIIIDEYKELLKKEKKARNEGKYNKIGELHMLIHEKKKEIQELDE